MTGLLCTRPNVVRIEQVYLPELTLDISALKPLPLKATDTPTHAELAAILEGKPDITRLFRIDLEDLGRKHRLQTIVFKIARDVFEQMQPKWPGSKEVLLDPADIAGLLACHAST